MEFIQLNCFFVKPAIIMPSFLAFAFWRDKTIISLFLNEAANTNSAVSLVGKYFAVADSKFLKNGIACFESYLFWRDESKLYLK